MLRVIAALALASATAHPTTHSTPTPPANEKASTVLPNSPWWERVTVTISGDGKSQSCRFESSLKPAAAKTCDVTGDQAAMASQSGAKDETVRLTFERRFKPGSQPDADTLQPGETLLGGQVMALGIDPRGDVKTCKVVSQLGSMRPEYGCDEATAEHFEASAGGARTATQREGTMTIVVYGHSEHMV